MPKIDVARVPLRATSGYPAEFQKVVEGRSKQALGNAAGLTQFGVNKTVLKPGAASSVRHWHVQEDEFVYVLEGELTLIENEGETILRAGDAAGFKANVPNGHQLINRSSRDAVYLEVGTRSKGEIAHYVEVDLALSYGADGKIVYTHKNGEPY
jgi:uncharacterized cupin superfamily protein